VIAARIRAGRIGGRVLARTLAGRCSTSARRKPVFAPFFGGLARCDRGAGVLLKRLRAPVFFGACCRTGERWRWRLVLGPAWEAGELARETPEEIARRINAEIERMILEAPEPYFWLHDRYRGAPEG
jgi:lauroyl/myristoyl acyltransferase